MRITYLQFLKTIEDEESKIKWTKGVKYKVNYETDDLYYVSSQHGTKCAIEKKLEGTCFNVFRSVIEN